MYGGGMDLWLLTSLFVTWSVVTAAWGSISAAVVIGELTKLLLDSCVGLRLAILWGLLNGKRRSHSFFRIFFLLCFLTLFQLHFITMTLGHQLPNCCTVCAHLFAFGALLCDAFYLAAQFVQCTIVHLGFKIKEYGMLIVTEFTKTNQMDYGACA